MKFLICTSILSAGIIKFANAACGGAYAQCGGNNFAGEACCLPGYKCVVVNEWYHQCQADGSADANASSQNSNDNNNNNQWVSNGWNGNNANQWENNGNQWENNGNQWENNGNQWENNGWSWGNDNNNQNQNQDQNQNQNQWNNDNNNQNQNQSSAKTIPQQQSNAKTLPQQQQQQQSNAKTLPQQQQQQSNAKTIPQQQNTAKTLPQQQQQQSNAKTLPQQQPQQQQNTAKTLPQQQPQQQQNTAKTIPQQQNTAKTLPQEQPQQQQSNAKTLPQQQNTSTKSLPQQQQQSTSKSLPQEQQQTSPQSNASGNGSTQNFFVNEIYPNPKFIEEIDSSLEKLDGELKAKAEKVKNVPTAVWLAWEGAPAEVEDHLKAAGSKTVVFILYMIPTRDCNSLASAGGASSLETYKGYIDSISNTIKSYPNSKVVMVVEPDTLGNLVTGTSESCKTVHTLHKNALSYAVNVFGAMSNVSVYLDAAHGKWLGSITDKVAAVIKEILSNAPNGKIRGLSTNVSNYQPVASEYAYHQKLASSLAAAGYPDMHFIVDTGRNGVDITEAFSKTETWCNFVGTGFGERPKGNPNPSMPLLDAYMWLKTPGEADGSDKGSRADPVCARPDSLPGSPDAGQWFHDYFVQLLKNAKPEF